MSNKSSILIMGTGNWQLGKHTFMNSYHDVRQCQKTTCQTWWSFDIVLPLGRVKS
ncbi:MAG: hypothetical protein HCA25_12770 [Dolichospermum sp. DET50]|nr:hypothetical protein [Dolichospermum sp. DET66]MBS3033118.1 hypothetical protein [Dolichospermum sp. DET67]MBS3038323.1 hypothetical protein [Dolichospermum sp. DET50]QSX70216.1 MAG: hypothetical protein EZY12_11985 [Dolichospermum sp. DET69]